MDEHPPTCACGGERLLRGWATNQRGDRYDVWSRCPGYPGRHPVAAPGPEMGLGEYLEQFPGRWYTLAPDPRDHEWARRAARALVNDPGAQPVSQSNPLAPLVARYVIELRS